jgi:hypothetical protein
MTTAPWRVATSRMTALGRFDLRPETRLGGEWDQRHDRFLMGSRECVHQKIEVPPDLFDTRMIGKDVVGSRHDGDDARTICDGARDHERDVTDRVVADAEIYGRDRVAENAPAPIAATGRVAVAQKDLPGWDNLGHIVQDRLHILEPQLLACREWTEDGEGYARGDDPGDAPGR